MTKEENLKSYKEDALDGFCETFEKELDKCKIELASLRTSKANAFEELDKIREELIQMKDTFLSVDKLYEKLKQLPAEDFLNLYCKMKNLVDHGTETMGSTMRIATSNGRGLLTTN